MVLILSQDWQSTKAIQINAGLIDIRRNHFDSARSIHGVLDRWLPSNKIAPRYKEWRIPGSIYCFIWTLHDLCFNPNGFRIYAHKTHIIIVGNKILRQMGQTIRGTQNKVKMVVLLLFVFHFKEGCICRYGRLHPLWTQLLPNNGNDIPEYVHSHVPRFE